MHREEGRLHPVDWRGQRLAEGDKVIYARVYSSMVELIEGEIEKIDATEKFGISPYYVGKVRLRLTGNKSRSKASKWDKSHVTITNLRNLTRVD